MLRRWGLAALLAVIAVAAVVVVEMPAAMANEYAEGGMEEYDGDAVAEAGEAQGDDTPGEGDEIPAEGSEGAAEDGSGKPSSSRLQIHVPSDLFKSGGGYDHREALFGRPPYGGSITQTVYYTNSELCDPTFDTTTGFPVIKDKNGVQQPWAPPFILMVDRGGCSFVTKARNAQRSGAAGMVIADNRCLCGDPRCPEQQDCESREPIMADDGSGGDISIPSFLMFKVDADAVIAKLKENVVVQMEMAWALPSPDDRVEYQLWSVPSDFNTREFLTTWKPAASALGKKAFFTPHMFIQDGNRNGCVGGQGANCMNLCTNGGRYCATDPDFDVEHGVSGEDVVKESLRRLCIWQQHGEDGIGLKWWDYVTAFTERCDNHQHFASDTCITDAYNLAGIDAGAIDGCMSNSGDPKNPALTNVYLESEVGAAKEMGVVVLPSAYVNMVVLRGALTAAEVFMGICAGFADGTEPPVCSLCAKSSDVQACITGSHFEPLQPTVVEVHHGVSPGFFFLAMIGVCGILAGVYFWYWKRSRDDMREQVRGILADYMPLEENADGANHHQGFFGFAKRTQGPPTQFIS